MKNVVVKALKRIISFGNYFIIRPLISIVYHAAFAHGALSYLSKEEYLVWKRSMIRLLRETSFSGYSFRHKKLIFTFARAKIEVVRKTNPTSPDVPIVVLCVKNDLKRIQMLTNHYRKLGIEKMAFMDNGSDDGTFEWLLEQSDVDLYRCYEPYETLIKEGWINRIVSHYGFDRWYIVTDSDELCTYIGIEDHPIRDVIAFAEKNEIRRFRGLTIDMYADRLYQESDHISQDFRWMDYNTYHIKRTRLGKVQYDAYFGGPRYRLMNATITLSKWPLVYWEKGTVSDNAHYQFPHEYLSANDCFIGILHYKFIKEDRKVFQYRAQSGSGFTGGKWYRYYVNGAENSDGSFVFEDSIVFNGSESLKRVSLISDMHLDRID